MNFSLSFSKFFKKEILDFVFILLINILLISFFISMQFNKDYINNMIQDDHIGQWFQFLFYASSSVIFFIRFCYNKKIMSILLSLLTFFIAGEELAWGQRLFRYTLPFIQSRNLENKIELHNMISLRGNIWVYIIFSLGILCVAPLFERFFLKQNYGYFANTKLRWIYLELIPFYLIMTRLTDYDNYCIFFYEYTELFIALSFFFISIRSLDKYTKKIL